MLGRSLDILIVSQPKDFKLLRHLLASYNAFCKIPGKIHIVLSKKDIPLFKKVITEKNISLHSKEDYFEPCHDDFKNQMYIKLHGDKIVETEWFWCIDSDFLFCENVYLEDLEENGKPIWYYDIWDDISEKYWRENTESFLGEGIEYLMMDVPLYILNRTILIDFRKRIDVSKILSDSGISEYVAYGAFSKKYFPEKYKWRQKDGSEMAYRVNQRPPKYISLSDSINLNNFANKKIIVFWSHWDFAEKKMIDFLEGLRQNAKNKLSIDRKKIFIPYSIEEWGRKGFKGIDGCYQDDWLKREILFEINTKEKRSIIFHLETPQGLKTKIKTKNNEKEIFFGPLTENARNEIPLYPGLNKIEIYFVGKGLVEEETGRKLFSKVIRTESILMENNMKIDINSKIKKGSIIGINYSGMHDASLAVLDANGELTLALSLERLSRVKGDGRWPHELIEDIDSEKISHVAFSTNEEMPADLLTEISGFPSPGHSYGKSRCHDKRFYDFISKIRSPKTFVDHQEAHAASAFWSSGYDRALCITYDGGMYNSPWFMGSYICSRKKGIEPIALASVSKYPKITSLYTFVTALLGFKPNRHEGKITGLAARGKPSCSCMDILKDWWLNRYDEIESCFDWKNTYAIEKEPIFLKNLPRVEAFRKLLSDYSDETIAASIQSLCELHVVEVIKKIKENVHPCENLCLAGGLFSNVKLNQVISEKTNSNIFVFPAMGDEGTAAGAAMQIYFEQKKVAPQKIKNVFLGPFQPKTEEIKSYLSEKNITFQSDFSREEKLASLLSEGKVVAIFRGRSEFGPRALGHRSILAQASKERINETLNERLNRTDFMPFAPIIQLEDLENYFEECENKKKCTPYMTVTLKCKRLLKKLCPAIVHVDGTARPQSISIESDPFLHGLLSKYKEITGLPCLINTSFNVHEEPIVETFQDALKGFFVSKLDYLYIEDVGLIPFEGNECVAIDFLSEACSSIKNIEKKANDIIFEIQKENDDLMVQCVKKEEYITKINQRMETLKKTDKEMLEFELLEKERLIEEKALKIKALEAEILKSRGIYTKAFHIKNKIKSKILSVFRPRLGMLKQHFPRNYDKNKILKNPKSDKEKLRVSVVTPSFNQGDYIEETIKSVVQQSYKNIEYIIQDGNSRDETAEILKKYEGKVSVIESQEDQGQSDAINKGFSKSTGEILCWLNSDDLFFENTVAHVVKIFEKNPDVDVVYGDRIIINEKGKKIGRWLLPGHCSKVLGWVDFIPQETLFWRRSIWEKVDSKVDESFRFAMDWDLLIRFKKAGANFYHTPNFLGAFRYHDESKTSSKMASLGIHEMNRVRKFSLGYIPSNIEIKQKISPFVIRHLIRDFWFRIKLYQPFSFFKPRGFGL